jgi:hypothetical protein
MHVVLKKLARNNISCCPLNLLDQSFFIDDPRNIYVSVFSCFEAVLANPRSEELVSCSLE